MVQKRILSPQQDIAANPQENVWVQANAGTGKTSVLIQRLLRILFRMPKNSPSGILCLTYTNAAAGEMRNRILSALRTWACASDDDLVILLDGVAINSPATENDIARAREIFFKYIDCPDMLKIKTIHGFCEEILHRFPLEAGLSPAWSLISDYNQRVLMQDAFARLINSADGDDKTRNAFAHIVERLTEDRMPLLLDNLRDQYKYFFKVENFDNYRKYFIDTTKEFLELNNQIIDATDVENLKKIIENAEIEQNSLKKPVNYLDKIIKNTRKYIDKTLNFDEYKKAYLNADGMPLDNVSKKEYLSAEQDRVYRVNQYNLNNLVYEDTIAMFDLSAAFSKIYRDLKRARNVLDFEDLILYTRKLFSNPETMGWVLSQLDLSLSHILLDEAQDTSPMQWDILRMLSGDFFTDGDADEYMHSLFVVGDSKQSIYGFQGADPNAFATSRDEISAQIKNNLRTIREVPLAQSFRSLSSILYAVDEFFCNPSVVELSGFSNNRHTCFRRDTPGLVEVYKSQSKLNDGITVTEYIKSIADKIKSIVDAGEYSACDIMVLVQKRNPLTAPLVVELKRRGIDVAGSDRIVLPRFPAIRDMLNLIRFCLDPTDDYSLCCVLKSPIFRLKERDIYNICKIKNDENKSRRADNPDAVLMTVFDVLQNSHPDIYMFLTDVISWAGDLGPYSFFSRLLNSHNIRHHMIAALGAQINDPIEEFMTICLSYERTQPGTLHHFIKWFITGGSEIKRDMDATSGVRIATVHGSKGLEAPVVFLIDTVDTPKCDTILPITADMLGSVHRAGDNFPTPWLWSPRDDNSQRRAVAADRLMQSHIAEYYRLLYVAMTRARDRLYIYGYSSRAAQPPKSSWHAQLWDVLGNLPAAVATDDCIRIVYGE